MQESVTVLYDTVIEHISLPIQDPCVPIFCGLLLIYGPYREASVRSPLNSILKISIRWTQHTTYRAFGNPNSSLSSYIPNHVTWAQMQHLYL